MRLKGKNTFVTLLSLFGVKCTESFSERYFNEHPHKNNLYGLLKMLSDLVDGYKLQQFSAKKIHIESQIVIAFQKKYFSGYFF